MISKTEEIKCHAIAATVSEPQAHGHRHGPEQRVLPGKAPISAPCLHAVMVSSKQPVVGRPVRMCLCKMRSHVKLQSFSQL
ncbi:hypothetical protein AMECASPLE_006366 [Ameca splendens]|uniref:Uncharacterized protein n=1 Tax=Ameca splendens TaxID=208324 RepID=A0ABV1A5N6_9TELE